MDHLPFLHLKGTQIYPHHQECHLLTNDNLSNQDLMLSHYMYSTLQMATAEIKKEVPVPAKKAKASSAPLSTRKPVPFTSKLPEKKKKTKDLKSYSLQSKAPAEQESCRTGCGNSTRV